MNELVDLVNNFSALQSSKLAEIGPFAILFVLCASAIAAYAVSLLYLVFYQGNTTGSQIHRAFPLLGVAITAIFVSIQFSLPLSLGLLGALSIVRFRTPIKEPEEIGFLMVVIATSLACAIFNFVLVLWLIGLSIAILVFVGVVGYPVRSRARAGLIVVEFSGDPESLSTKDLIAFLNASTRGGQVESIVSQGDSGRSVLSYRMRASSKVDVEKVQSHIQTLDPAASVDIYLGQQ